MKTSIRVRGQRPDLAELAREFGLISKMINGTTIIEMDSLNQEIPPEISRSSPSIVIEVEETTGENPNLVCGEHGGALKPYRISREGTTKAHFIANRVFVFSKERDKIRITKVSAEIIEDWGKKKLLSCKCITYKDELTRGTPEEILESFPALRQPLLAFVEKLSCNCDQLHYIYCNQGKVPCCTCKKCKGGKGVKNHRI